MVAIQYLPENPEAVLEENAELIERYEKRIRNKRPCSWT